MGNNTHLKLGKIATFSIISIMILGLTGCASYKATALNQPSPDIIQSIALVKNDVRVTAKAFNRNDCLAYLDRDVIKQGYQPVQIFIKNDSDKSYTFSLSRLNLATARPEEVANTVHTSTIGRAAGYGAGALILWPLAIPAIVDGVKSSQANQQLDLDYTAKAAKDTVVFPKSNMNALIFVPKVGYSDKLSLTLLEQSTNAPLSFDVQIVQ